MFVAGFLAVLYVARGVYTPTLSEELAQSLVRMVYGVICFATFFNFLGTEFGLLNPVFFTTINCVPGAGTKFNVKFTALHVAVGALAIAQGARGVNFTVSTACSSGAIASRSRPRKAALPPTTSSPGRPASAAACYSGANAPDWRTTRQRLPTVW